MCRINLPRVYEIRDCVAKRGGSQAYFQDFENSLVNNPVKRKHFLHIEAELAVLDSVAWAYLKAEVVPLFGKKNPPRGWQAAFDKLNQAKAYNYLERLGCTELAFIPESTASGQKTPDLEGTLCNNPVLCEVKTINPSDVEAAARGQMIARSIQGCLPEAFLTSCLRRYGPPKSRWILIVRILMLNISFMSFSILTTVCTKYVDGYWLQIQNFCVSGQLPRVEIVFDAKPACYSATSDSSASDLFVCSVERSWQRLASR